MFRKLFFLLFISFVFLGCDKNTQQIKVGISPWPGYEPLLLALEKGFYESSSVKVIRYTSPVESFKALRNGSIDVAAFTVDEVLHYADVCNKPKIILVLDVSNGGDAIVSKPYITKVSELKGKTIATEGSALADYVLKRAFELSNDTEQKDIKFKKLDIGQHLYDYEKNGADAYITYEPSKTQLLNAGANLIFSSKEIPNEIIDVLVTNEDIINDKKDLIQIVVDGWFKALKYINLNKQEAMNIMSDYEEITPEEFEKSYDELIIPTDIDNIKMSDGKTIVETLNKLSTLMYKNKTITKDIDTKEIVDSRFLKAIK